MSDINNHDWSSVYSAEQNSHAITQLTSAMSELTANTHRLLDYQNEIRDCIRLVYAHNNEIESLKQRIKQNQLALENIQNQFKKLEQRYLIHHTTYEARVNLLTSSIRYGPMLMAAIITIVSVVIAFKELHL